MIVFYDKDTGEVTGYENFRVGEISNGHYVDISYDPLPTGVDPFDYRVDLDTKELIKKDQASIDANMLSKKRDEALNAIRDRYAAKMRTVVLPYTKEERDTWQQQKEEAYSYIVDNTVGVPMIFNMAQKRGITLDELVTKIIAKSGIYSSTIGDILGEQHGKEDAIDAIYTDIVKTTDEKIIDMDALVASISLEEEI